MEYYSVCMPCMEKQANQTYNKKVHLKYYSFTIVTINAFSNARIKGQFEFGSTVPMNLDA